MENRILFILSKYGMRRTKRQKEKFRSFVKNYVANIDEKITIESYQEDRLNGENLILGDLDMAKIVFVAPYDTGERILDNEHKRYINNFEKNRSALLKNKLFYILVGFFISFIALYLIRNSFLQSDYLKIIQLLIGGILLVTGVKVSRGFHSKHNAAQSIPITLLLDYLGKNKDLYSLVLLDDTENLDLGLATFLETHDLSDKYIIRIGNMGYGDRFVGLTTQKNGQLSRLNIENLEIIDAYMDNEFLKHATKEYIYLSWCEEDEYGYYILYYGTKNDVSVKQYKIEKMLEVMDTIKEGIYE